MRGKFFAALVIGWVILSSISFSATYGGGSGTAADPYQIWTPEQMNTIGANSADWGKCFILMANIDMSVYTGTQYNIIGNSSIKFMGTFEGNGYIIINLTYATSELNWYLGMFGYIENATIRNVNIANVNLSTLGCYVGALVGYNKSSSIISCCVSGLVTGNDEVGGLIGLSSGSLISCYATCSVNGRNRVGGLIGYQLSGSITNSFCTGNITGSNNVGGMLGYQYSGSITNCYSTGSTTGNSYIGGLIGYQDNPSTSTIDKCYSTGRVTGNTYKGGLLGFSGGVGGTATSGFWDIVTSGLTISRSGTGKNTAEMKTISTFISAGWDFSTDDGDPADWCIPHAEYPKLIWQVTQVPVPDVIGMTQVAAQTVLTTAGFNIGRVTQAFSDTIPVGNIVSQTPFGGTSVGVGSVVNLVVSQGVAFTTPDVTGMPQADAESVILSAGLSVGAMTTSYHGLIPAGYIINQSPIAGQSVPYGTPVNLIISLGNRYSGGNGTQADPFLISTPQDLNTIGTNSSDWSKYFKLMTDIDMSAYTATQYNIIGNSTNPFMGTFDGNGYKIHNLTYSTTESINYVGLFGYTSNAIVKNLGMENVSISSAGRYLGGIAGFFTGSITNCYCIGNVTGTASNSNYVGGIVGDLSSSTISSIAYSFSTGNVTGNNYIGGLVGFSAGLISNCFSTSSVNGYLYLGGLVGCEANVLQAKIDKSYSIGKVTGTSIKGGLLGIKETSATVTVSFWDIQTSSMTTSAAGTGKTTAQMQTQSTFTSSGWDFSNADGDPEDWFMPVSEYPKLVWQLPSKTIPDVVGMTQNMAHTVITAAGLAMGNITYDFSNAMPAGRIMNQLPIAGASAYAGSVVNLVFNQPVVPDIVEMIQTDAQSAIIAGGLCVGSISTDYHDSLPAGSIISQSPSAGSFVNLDSLVNFVVSLGPHYSGGSGTEIDPFLISTPQDLNQIGTIPADWNKYFRLTADIDMSAYTGTQYKIIGNLATKFTGIFDGDGYTITNLTYMTTASVDYVGLFGYISNATIKNLGLKNISISSAGSYLGGLVGYVVSNSYITNCYCAGSVTSTGSITGTIYIGGLVGRMASGAVTDSFSDCIVSGGAYVGGVVGYQGSGFITNCHNMGSVIGYTGVGGLIGNMYSTSMNNCYNTGSITGTSNSSYIGGLVGSMSGSISNCANTGNIKGYNRLGGLVGYYGSSTLANSFSSGNVKGDRFAGGLVGYQENTSGSKMEKCYSTGKVYGNTISSTIGGLLAYKGNIATVSASFWDIQASGTIPSAAGTGKVTAEMTMQDTFTSAGWDFVNTWFMPAGDYPRLRGLSLTNIPDVVGLTHTSAYAAISSAGLTVGSITYNVNNLIPAGCIISQSPAAGSSGYIGSPVNLVVSLDVALTVPDLVGLTQIEAQAAITAAELAVGDFAHAFSDSVPEGNVISQSPPEGQLILSGTCIDLVISAGPHYSGGKGTAENPYLIYTSYDLNLVGNVPTDWNGFFKLMADIDMSEYTGTQYNIIGNFFPPFGGTFDGNKHVIRNLAYTTTSTDSCYGLFGYTLNATIKNLGVENINISTNGSLAGGIAGSLSGTITNCYCTGSVRGLGTSSDEVGGLVGRHLYGTITNSYSICSVTGNDKVGGLAGSQSSAVTFIINCYSSGDVTGNSYVGGLLGYQVNYASAKIEKSYSTGQVTGNANTGGLLGYKVGSSSIVTASFWDTQTSGITTSPAGTGKTTAQLKTQSTFTSAGWDFVNETANGSADIWFIRQGQEYPKFVWETQQAQDGLVPLGFVTVNKTRVGRTSFEYELAVTVRNSNAFAMNNVQMKLMDWDAAVQSVSDDSITIDTIPAGATVTSTDTFKIVVDRSTLINSSRLVWELTYYTVASGDQVQQAMMSMLLSDIEAGALGGDITGDGKVNLEDLAVMSAQWNTVPGNPSADIAEPLDDYVGIEDLMCLAENWMN